MNYPSKLQWRFEETINILKNNIKDYLLLNLWLFLIWVWLFAVVSWILLLFLMTTWLFSYLNIQSLNLNDYGLNLILIIIFIILIVYVLFWILWATIFIWNFYLTKRIDNWEKVDFKELFLKSYKKLWNKAIVDFWYFLIFFGLFLLYILWIFVVQLFWMFSSVLVFILLFVVTVLFIYYLIDFAIKYYFASFYCFDTEDFSFENFKESSKIVENKKLEVFLNILLITILVYVFSSILWIFIDSLFSFSFLDTTDYSVIIASLVSISFVVYVILKYLINILASIFSFVYMYIYYRFLEKWENKIESDGKVENLEEKREEI